MTRGAHSSSYNVSASVQAWASVDAVSVVQCIAQGGERRGLVPSVAQHAVDVDGRLILRNRGLPSTQP
jgi:hypothetical protein